MIVLFVTGSGQRRFRKGEAQAHHDVPKPWAVGPCPKVHLRIVSSWISNNQPERQVDPVNFSLNCFNYIRFDWIAVLEMQYVSWQVPGVISGSANEQLWEGKERKEPCLSCTTGRRRHWRWTWGVCVFVSCVLSFIHCLYCMGGWFDFARVCGRLQS